MADENDNTWPVIIVLAVGGCCMFGDSCGGGGGGGGTDGVFESATEKMDRGEPLNDRERKRINDIIDYKD